MAKKQPGDDLEPKLKEELESMSDEDLRKKVSEVALLKQALEDEKKNDPDVQQKREELNTLVADRYGDDIKGAKEQIAYIKSLLQLRGKL